MRALAILLLLLVAGCASNDQVRVWATNELDATVPVQVTITWDGATPATWFDATIDVPTGDSDITTFTRPCDGLGAGSVTYTASYADASATWVQEWPADGCVEQHIWLFIGEGLEWRAAYT